MFIKSKSAARLAVLEKIAHAAAIWSDYSKSGYLPGDHSIPSDAYGEPSEDQILSHVHNLLSELERIDTWRGDE